MFYFKLNKSQSSVTQYTDKQQVVLRKLKEKYPNFEWLEVPEKLVGVVRFKCHKGMDHKNNAFGLLNQKYPCRTCANLIVNAGKSNKIDAFINKVHRVNGHLLTVVRSSYISSKQPVKFICKNCSQERMTRGDALFKKRKYGCPNCCASFKVRTMNKVRFMFDGKQFLLGSATEYQALLYLRIAGYKNDEVVGQDDPRMPFINYSYSKRKPIYNPDFFIPSENTIIEVKGDRPLRKVRELKLLKAKRQGCIDAGYKFKLMVIHRQMYLLDIPEDWYEKQIKDLGGFYSTKTFYERSIT